MRVAQLIMLISISSGSEGGSGVPTVSPSFRPTAEAAFRLGGSIPPTVSPTFLPTQEKAGRRRLGDDWESARRFRSKDRDPSELSPLELEQRDCDIGLEMPYRYLADWCQSLKEEEACNRSYELMGTVKDRKKSGLAFAMACKWYSGPDPTANVDPTEAWVGRSVCAADVNCIVVKDWVAVRPGNYTSGKNGNEANGNSGSDSPPELTSIDLSMAPSRRPTARPTQMPSRMPTELPTTATPTAGPSATPTSTPSRAPTAAPSRSPTRSPTRGPTPAPSAQPTPAPSTALPSTAPTSRPVSSAAPSPPPASGAGFSPRCGKLKVLNKKVGATKVDADGAEDCYGKCSEVCDGCERYDSWSYKVGSKAPCTCFGLESEFKLKESAEFFGATDEGSRPQCGSLKVGKKGTSLYAGKMSSPVDCQWRCGGHGNGNEGYDVYEQFHFKYAKGGKTGDCICVSGKVKKKQTQTFGFTS